jgi:hypothetical protein
MRTLLVKRSFKEKPKGSNSREQPFITNKFASGTTILDDGWRDKNIIKNKGGRCEVSSTSSNNRKARTVTNDDMMRINA